MSAGKDRTKANLGASWESVLDGLHANWDRANRLSIFRTPPPMKVIGRVPSLRKRKGFGSKPPPPDYRCVYLGAGPPDYAATDRGMALLFDAKEARGDRWDFAHLAEHQAERFDRHEVHGVDEDGTRRGLAFVLLRLTGEHGIGADVYVLPWRELGPRWRAWSAATGRASAGGASVKPSTEPWALRVPAAALDWLAVVRTLYPRSIL